MQYIKANNLEFCYEDQTENILENISFEIITSSRTGLIGKNGSGKTTILKLLQRIILPTQGNIYFNKEIRFGFLPQEIAFSKNITVLDYLWNQQLELFELKKKIDKLEEFKDQEVVEILENYEKLRGYKFENRVEKIISKFEFDPKILERKLSTFSGGEKTKIALCRIIVGEPDILLLDEPTNHLDVNTLNWLENYLRKIHIPFLVISHDRKFLDNCVEKIWELDKKTLKSYSGNYSFYKNEKEIEFQRKMHEYDVQQKKIKQLKSTLQKKKDKANKYENYKEKRSIKKNGGKCQRDVPSCEGPRVKNMMRNVMASEKRIELILDKEQSNKPFIEKERKIKIQNSNLKCRFVLKIENLSKSYNQKKIFQNLTFSVKNHSKLNITGSNGSGKSTLLKIIIGDIQDFAGSFCWSPQTKIGYYSQEFDNLDSEKTIIDEILQGNMEEQTFVRTVLGSFNIRNDMVYQKINSLSIGERSKIFLAKIITSDANILILDEPTNHLEISAREALEEALQDYDGSLIFVSHDRYLQEKLATDVLDLDKK
ncbi:MAG: ABC-F type ribosomal protection protein [Candidatus Cloacimonetes bacterium]|nr:ABC-F type ribosomal protection protein [Candidatus Cloacimonadota bacterium]